MSYDKRLEQLSNALWQQITQIDELKGRWIQGVNIDPVILGRLKQSVLITSSGASTRIEGAKMTDVQVEEFIGGLKIEKMNNRDEQEVRSYYELLRNVFDHWQSIKFNETTIKHFHGELLKYVDKDQRHRGQYKTSDNKVVALDTKGQQVGIVFDTTAPYLTPKAMEELVAWTQQSLDQHTFHPLLLIANFVIEFLIIHPFADGNGRLSRILTNLLLLQYGYRFVPYISHEKLVEDNKQEYYLALRKSQKTFGSTQENINPWLEFFLAVSLNQATQAVKLLSEQQIEHILAPQQLAIWHYFQEHSEASAGQFTKATKIPRPTVNQALEKLLRLGKIQRLGSGRGTRYRLI